MRILVITSYFGPETSVGVLRVNAFVKYWAAAGHDIDVVTMPFIGNLPDSLKNSKRIRIFPVAPYLIGGFQSGDSQVYARGATGIKKKIVELRYWLKKKYFSNYMDPRVLWWPKVFIFVKNHLLAQNNYDFLYSTVPSYTAHSAAAAIKTRCPKMFWVADYRDYWSGNSVFPGCSLVRAFERKHERWIVKKADLIVSINDSLVTYLKNMHGGDRYLVVPNGFEDSELTPDMKPETSDFEHGDKPKTLITYTGSILPGGQDPSSLLLAIKHLENDRIIRPGDLELRFYGDYTALEKFPLAKDPIVEKFILKCGNIPRSQVLNVQKKADFLLFLGSQPVVEGIGSTAGVISGKIFEYLISGTEIIALGVYEDMIVAEMLTRSQCGDYYGEDVDKIKHRLKRAIHANGAAKVKPDMSYLSQFRRSRLSQVLIDEVGHRMGKRSLSS